MLFVEDTAKDDECRHLRPLFNQIGGKLWQIGCRTDLKV